MNVLTHMSDIMIPMVIFWIVGYGMVARVKVYETFLKGAKEGLRIVAEDPSQTGRIDDGSGDSQDLRLFSMLGI